MDYELGGTELLTDPIGKGYAGKTAGEITALLNQVNRQVNKTSISGSQAFNLTDEDELIALTDVKRNQWLMIGGIDDLDPFGPVVRLVLQIFGSGSNTVAALSAFRVKQVSRATEIGLTPEGVPLLVGEVEEMMRRAGWL